MDIANLGKESEILHSQAHIWNCIFISINSASLKCAVQLGIPDIVHKHGKPITLSELNACLPINPAKAQNILRLMNLLVHFGFFTKERVLVENKLEEDGYLLAPASRLLLEDESLNVRPFLLAMLDPVLTKPLDYMSEWFQNEDLTPFNTAHGKGIWEYSGEESRFGGSFNDAMASDARLVISVVLKKCRDVFMGLNSLVDVGGGTGTVAKSIADAFPELNCTVFDLPHVVSGLGGCKNLRFVGGDMFVEIPPSDAVILKWILHDWSDEESVKILKKCKEAIPSKEKGGKVIIINMMVDNKKGSDAKFTETQLLFDMLMMILATGKERNETEWAKLFSDAGFSDYKITPVLGLRSLIEVYP